MTGKLAGILGTLLLVLYVGYLTYRAGSLALAIIVGTILFMAVLDLYQTEFQRRENSRRS